MILERKNASASQIDAFCAEVMHARLARNWSILFSAHQMGTCRMGTDRRQAVCDAGGHVFGVEGLFIGDGSAFPAASGVNPMLTIMTLAHHTAQRIKSDIRA
jgi:choline dehydrogenase-like flavoprotein